MTRLIAKDKNNQVIKSWVINQNIEAQLCSLKAEIESMGMTFSVPILLHAKEALNQKIEQDIISLDVNAQQLQDITQFSNICLDIERLPQNDEIKLIINK